MRSLGLLMLACALPAWASADVFGGVRQEIRQQMQQRGVPGMAVAVWQEGRPVWEEGFGWADQENRVPASAHTMFSLASISKPLTAIGLMTLVQAGRIAVDRPINDYLGDDPLTSRIGDPRQVTVRSVLTHMSGLAMKDDFYYGDDLQRMPGMSESIRRYGVLVAPAGERFKYSNLGYGVLGHVAARVAGTSYGDFMRQAVFAPLGMTHSSVGVAPGLEQYQAARYDRTGLRIPFFSNTEQGAAAVYSSAHDLARLGMFFVKHPLPEQRPILNHESIDAMTARTVAEPNGGRYGLGWGVRDVSGYRLIEHGGGMSGVSTFLTLIPQRKLAVVVLANSESVPVRAIRDSIFAAMLPDWNPVTQVAAATTAPAAEPTSQWVGTWQGTIHTSEDDIPIRLRILPAGEVRVWIRTSEPWRNRFQLESVLNEASFSDGLLTGRALSQIDAPGTQRLPHTVALSLRLRDKVLNGSVSAISSHKKFWVYELPYWTELNKISDADVGGGF